ncbi:MAG: hypothetical protein HY985_16165 [Magnetospirillum sp.]|nr:hypothetical protein [Magnetospirillum sp.]
MLAFDFTVNAVLFRAKVQSGAWRQNLDDLYDGRIDTEVAFFGSSRIYLHVDPEEIVRGAGLSAYNLGLDGTNIEHHLFTLTEYLAFNRPPKVVVLGLDVAAFDPALLRMRPEVFRAYSPRSERAYALVNATAPSPLMRLEMFVERNIMRSLAFRNRIPDVVAAWLNRHAPTPGGEPVRGGLLRDQILTADPAPPPLEPVAVTTPLREAFGRFIAVCRERSIPLLVVQMPYYYDIPASTTNRADVEAVIHAELAGYAGADFLDLGSDPDFLGRKDLFYNQYHLNRSGAQAASAKVAARLRANGWGR